MKWILALITLLCISSVNSQDEFFDFKTGFNRNSIVGTDQFLEQASGTGFLLGAGMGFISGNGLTFNFGIDYVQKNSAYKFSTPSVSDIIFNRHYLAVPFSVGYQLGEDKFVYFNAGIAPAIKVKMYNKYDVGSGTISGDDKTDETWDYALLEFSGFARIGGGIAISPDLSLIAEATFYRGLTPFSLLEDWEDYNEIYRGFSLQIGLRYWLSTKSSYGI